MKRQIIIIILVAALLSSCSIFGNGNDSIPPTDDTIKGREITFGFINIGQPLTDGLSTSSCIYKKIQEDFNINIVPITLGEDTWKQELDVMIANDELPDVFFHDINEDTMQYRQLLDLGLIRDVPKSMWAKRDNLARVMSWYEQVYSVDGKMYFVPRTYQTYDQTHGSSYAIIYRRDWANVVAAVPPDSPHFYDVMDMIKEFVAKDPNANNIKDTWGITGGDDLDFINNAFLKPFGVREWMYEDGKWIPGLLSSNAKEAVAWISQLYKEGVIDPDFVHQSGEDALNKFLTGKAGACLVSIYPQQIKEIERKWAIYNSNPISQSVDIMPLYFAPDGYKYNEVDTFSTGTLFSSDLKDKDLELVLDMMNWMYSDEGRTYLEYGENDTDYLIILGDIVPRGIDVENPAYFGERNTELKALENLVSWNLDYSSYYLDMMTEFQSYSKDLLENDIWAYSYESELFTKGMITPEMCVLNIETVARDMLFEVIMISSDFDAKWNEYVNYCYSTFNVEEASKEVAQRATELGIAPEG